MPAQYIDRMAVEIDGDGDAVVCVHGLGGTTNTWTPLVPSLARHRAVRIALAAAIAGAAYAHQAGVHPVLHESAQDAVLDQHRCLGRRSFVVDGE